MSVDPTKTELTLQDLRKMGGKARAKALTPERRKEIATKASHGRKCMSKLPKATHSGEIIFGDFKIP